MGSIDIVTDIRVRVGSQWKGQFGLIQIIAVAEGYVMARRPGQYPFVAHWTSFIIEFNLVTPPTTDNPHDKE